MGERKGPETPVTLVLKEILAELAWLRSELVRLQTIDYGSVSAPPPAGVAVLQDDSKDWSINAHTGRLVRLVGGIGAGQSRIIVGNSSNVLALDQLWTIRPNESSVYVILGEDLTRTIPIVVVPTAKADIFNQALPAAEAGWLAVDITPTRSPSYIRVYVCVSVTGVLRIARTVGGVTSVENLNSGVNLVASSAYMFTVPWRAGDSINVRYSVTAGTIMRLIIDEGSF